jgi:hypothetical protein
MVVFVSVDLCGCVFFIFRREGIFLIQFFTWVGKASSYHSFGLCVGFV